MNSKTLAEEKSSEEEVPNFLIIEMCVKWGDVQSFVEKCHPDSSQHFQCLILEKIGQVFTERKKKRNPRERIN